MTTPKLRAVQTPLTTEERLRHIAVVGKTGAGKSTLLRQVVVDDMNAGHGLLVVDPHGDLAAELIDLVPRRRRNDLVVFDPTDLARCPGLNPLRSNKERRSLLVSNILSIMKRMWEASLFGPRSEHVMRHILLVLTEVRGATLDLARDLLIDDRIRERLLKQVTDPSTLSFWKQEFLAYGPKLTAEVIAPVLNKLGGLLGSEVVRVLVTKRKPRLDPLKLMDRGAIVIARLPKGEVGEDATLFLGGLLLGAFQQAALSRAKEAHARRRPFFIIADEIGSFAPRPLLEMLAEGRKFGVGLVLATQSLAALDRETRAGILGTVGTLVAFRLGADDAEMMSREFVGDVSPANLMRLAVGEHVMRRGSGRAVLVPP